MSLIEDDVTGDDDAVGSEVHAPISLMMRGIAKKNASTRTRRQFMWHSGGGVGIA